MNKPVYSNDQIINKLNSGYSLGNNNITFAFPDAAFGYGEAAGFSAFNSTQKSVAREVMELWDDVSALSISESSGNSGTVRFANTNTSIAYAHAYYPAGDSAASSVWFSSNYSDLQSPRMGGYSYMVYIHEVGHALGLSHPGEYSGSGFNYNDHAEYKQDSYQYTVMSYFNASNTGADWNGNYAQTPMMHDILAIQAKYGKSTDTRTGDTTYGFNASGSVPKVFDFSSNFSPVVCFYDDGGVDTIDLSGYDSKTSFNLNPGSFSDADGMTKNLSIAFGVWIENVITGSAGDSVVGNRLNNVIRTNSGDDYVMAGRGNDQIYGGDGNDRLFGAEDSDFIEGGIGDDAILGGSGADTIYGDDGNDVIQGNEGIDKIWGGSGIDKIRGGTEADVLNGGDDNDLLNGEAGNDRLIGGLGDDKLYGGSGDDQLYGSSGNDYMRGNSGADTYYGGIGNDVYVLDDTGDRIVEYGGQGNDTVYVGSQNNVYVLANHVEVLRTFGTADFNLTANRSSNLVVSGSGNDYLNGAAGKDRLYGGAGNDTLVGGDHIDRLYGGAGSDLFVLSPKNDNGASSMDIIMDFENYSDQMDVGDLANIAGVSGVSELLEGGYLSITAEESATGIWFDVDGASGPESAYKIGHLHGISHFTVGADDFVI